MAVRKQEVKNKRARRQRYSRTKLAVSLLDVLPLGSACSIMPLPLIMLKVTGKAVSSDQPTNECIGHERHCLLHAEEWFALSPSRLPASQGLL